MAQLLVTLLGVYLFLGIVFALAFVTRGVQRIDPVAKDGTWGFRLIILPGVTALWPILALRWLQGRPPPQERNPHRNRAGESQ